MSKNILWQNLSGREIREMIRNWPVNSEAKTDVKQTVKKAVKTRSVKVTKPAGNKVVRQKHFGADGEVKFVPHRGLFVGFFGGRVVVTKRTEDACKQFLNEKFAVVNAA